jgi:hypothetical protein
MVDGKFVLFWPVRSCLLDDSPREGNSSNRPQATIASTFLPQSSPLDPTPMNLQKTRVYKLFAALTEADRQEFMRHLRRYSKPKRLRLKAGFRFLVTNSAAIQEGRATAQLWWEAVFSGMAFDVNQLRKHQNKLTAAISESLVEQRWLKEKDPYRAEVRVIEQQLLLMASVWDHAIDPFFTSLAQKTADLIAKLPEDHDRYALRYQLELQLIGHRQKVAPFSPIPHFASAQEALDRYYILSAFKLELANQSQRRRHSSQPLLDRSEAIQAVSRHLPAQGLLVKLCIALLQLDTETTVPQTDIILDQLFAAETQLSPEAWKDLLYLCLNFAIGNVNRGAVKFKSIVLRIYIRLLQSGLLQRDIGTFKHNFINIVKLSFFWDPPEEFARFAIAQKALIEHDPEYKNAAQFYECQRLFSSENFKGACPCFMKVWLLEGGRNVRYAAGVFLIKSYYERGQWDDLIQFSNDLKRIISKDKGIDFSKKEAYRRFLKGMHVLCNIQFQGWSAASKAKLKAVETLIQEDDVMISKGWFQIQILKLWKSVK